MKKHLLILGAALGVAVFLFGFASYTKKSNSTGNKVIICHIPPGNPENAHEIEVSEDAVPAHLAHGDSLGSCNGG